MATRNKSFLVIRMSCPLWGAPYWEIHLVTEEHIKKLAYSIWEREGFPEGKALEHYYRAEKMLKEQQARGT